ncbi:hypothetical protein CDAR_559171 [Caerostris darwini]|uniref:Uncharacterized protein n=1 Tax=Caerostris darwini TaxID=1538125 RepID=A0AAV4NZE5_9ARAC|nr:hypothetical protein CDAR_559171 [Caerostris darwini]
MAGLGRDKLKYNISPTMVSLRTDKLGYYPNNALQSWVSKSKEPISKSDKRKLAGHGHDASVERNPLPWCLRRGEKPENVLTKYLRPYIICNTVTTGFWEKKKGNSKLKVKPK